MDHRSASGTAVHVHAPPGHSFGFVLRVAGYKQESECIDTDHILPIVLTNNTLSESIPFPTVSFLQLSSPRSSSGEQGYRLCKTTVVHRRGECAKIEMSVVRGGNITETLDANSLPMLSSTGIRHSGIQWLKTRVGAISAKIETFDVRCRLFYNRLVPYAAEAEETDRFIGNGGVQPVIVETDVFDSACEMHALCRDGAWHRLPGVNAAPIDNVTDQWARHGGDPRCIPLGLSKWAVEQCNILLGACTLLERAVIYHGNENHVCNQSRLDEMLYLLSQADHLMVCVIGGGSLSENSEMYMDRFNATNWKDKMQGCCVDSSGRVQKIHSLVAHPFTSYKLASSGIPVAPVANIAFFDFHGELESRGGIQASIHLRTVPDCEHILESPSCYGDLLHASVDTLVYTHSNHTKPMLVRAKSYSFGPDDSCAHRAPLSSIATPSQCANLPVVPFSMELNTGASSSRCMPLSAMSDWVCCASNGTLVVQVDDPRAQSCPKHNQDTSRLSDATNCLLDVFAITYRSTQIEINRLGASADRDRLQLQLCEVDIKFVPRTRNTNVSQFTPERNKVIVYAAMPSIKRLVELIVGIQCVQQTRVLTDVASVKYSVLCTMLSRFNSVPAVLASRCLEFLQAAITACTQCRVIRHPRGVPPGESCPLPSWGSFSKLRPMCPEDQAFLGNVTGTIALCAYPRKACVLVRVGKSRDISRSDDYVVLMIDRFAATDPGYFASGDSSDLLRKQSSVRVALSLAMDLSPSELLIQAAWPVPIFGMRRHGYACNRTVLDDQAINGHRMRTIAVTWQSAISASRDWNIAFLLVDTSCAARTTRGSFDPRWGIRVLSTGVV